MDDSLMNYIKSVGVGCRHPHAEFFQAGNDFEGFVKTCGVVEIDDENYLHKIFPQFICHIPGCVIGCNSVFEYDQHYNTSHRFTCSQCNKNLPTSHLLDIHLLEIHDVYFAVQAENKPMCYIETCKETFQTPELRKDHGVTVHGLPGNFRFEITHRKKPILPKLKSEADDMKMDVVLNIPGASDQKCKKKSTKIKTPLGSHNATSRGRGRGRRPLLEFTTDLASSLPVQEH